MLGDIEGLPGWFGFHISLVLPFVYFLDTAPEATPRYSFPHLRANQVELFVSFTLCLLG
jgi:hypothetical protein